VAARGIRAAETMAKTEINNVLFNLKLSSITCCDRQAACRALCFIPREPAP
jgi:hypothetical protein